MSDRVEPPAPGGPEVGLIMHEGSGMGATLGCCLCQQVLGDAGQQLMHCLRCASSPTAAVRSTCHTCTRTALAQLYIGR